MLLGGWPVFLVDWLTNSLCGLDGWGLTRHDVIVAKRVQIMLLCSCLQPIKLNKSIIIHCILRFSARITGEGVRLT